MSGRGGVIHPWTRCAPPRFTENDLTMHEAMKTNQSSVASGLGWVYNGCASSVIS